jgi:two-component system phosphate regulon sensor histidine kinase PhoR
MTGGIRARLFLASIAVILLVGVPSVVMLRRELAATVERRARQDLGDQARASRVALVSLPELDGPKVQQVVDLLARDTGTQVDVIGFDSRLIASSSDEHIAGNVLDRPEVHDAIVNSSGFARRGGRAYYAVRAVGPDQAGIVVRISRPLDELDAAYDRLYVLMAVAAAIGVTVALCMTWLSTVVMTRALRRLAATARTMTGGGAKRIAIESTDELGALGGSLNALADGVEHTMTALARERALLESVLDTISQGVVALDADRRITLMNEAAQRLLELDTAPIGEALIDRVRIPAVIDLLPPAPPGTTEFQTTGGTRLVARVAPLHSGGGCILMLQDVTAMRRLETIRRDFVANVSHELRTPVSIIRANAETLIGGARDDAAFSGRLIDGVHRNAERLAMLLTDLLDLSRLEAGQYRIDTTIVDVRRAAEHAAAELAPAPIEKDIELAVEVPAGLAVTGDAKALDQCLVNLIENAVKYTPKGGHVRVGAARRKDRVRIEIRDDGPGIAPRHRERIFERFYRVDPGRSREAGGTGLGLSIVKHLVESMHGEVGVDANEPTGSIFWIELPGVDEVREIETE